MLHRIRMAFQTLRMKMLNRQLCALKGQRGTIIDLHWNGKSKIADRKSRALDRKIKKIERKIYRLDV